MTITLNSIRRIRTPHPLDTRAAKRKTEAQMKATTEALRREVEARKKDQKGN